MSWTVMVWVASVCWHRLRSERAHDHGVVARGIAAVVSAGHFDRHLTAVVRCCGVVHRHLVRALNRVVGRDEGELRSCGSWTVMVWVAEYCCQHRLSQ